jgi:hypothetical protein
MAMYENYSVGFDTRLNHFDELHFRRLDYMDTTLTPEQALNVISQAFVSKGGLTFQDSLLIAQAIQVLRELVTPKPEQPKPQPVME